MKKSTLLTPAAVLAVLTLIAGCAQAPDSSPNTSGAPGGSASQSTTGSVAAGDFKACMVSDTGGFDDKSFNQTSYAGLQKAVKELGVTEAKVQSKDAKDYNTNIQSMLDAKCKMIVTVGYSLGPATVAAAKANPNVTFAVVDWNDASAAGVSNLKPLVFNTAESSFMAGYLAAATSQTGKVGTFGGEKYPTVTIFMDGFAQGVAYYNQQKSKSVQVLGWDVKKQDGQFAGSFVDTAKSKTTANNLIAQGADVVFPVAGNAGIGALQAAQASGGKVKAIWVDTDGCVSAATYCNVLETSVYKAMDLAVFNAIKAAKDGSFSSDPFVGTLENQGTGLSPYHDFDSKLPADVKADLDKIKAAIIAGEIKITSAAQPK